jgi:hypothetical protein
MLLSRKKKDWQQPGSDKLVSAQPAISEETVAVSIPAPVQATKDLSMKPDAIYQRERRARKALRDAADLTPGQAAARIRAVWDNNLRKTPKQERQQLLELQQRFNQFNIETNEILDVFYRKKEELSADEIDFAKAVFVSAHQLAKEYPPTEDPVYIAAQYYGTGKGSKFEFTEVDLSKMPHYFRTYGLALDHVYGPIYNDLCRLFRKFYGKYRQTPDSTDEFATTWTEIDAIQSQS